MVEHELKINYLYHSGFSIETEKHLLIFDYFMDKVDSGIKSIGNGAIGENDLKNGKSIVVFSSHSHGDHFNPVILQWILLRPDIKYVLSSDIDVKDDNGIYKMSAYDELQVDDIKIKAYGSTDIGISFMVRADGVSIFHAGDLNWWYWWDDTEDEIDKATKNFKEEIRKMSGEKIDVAFFPVDPRLERNYSLGGEYFIKELKPTVFIPMHFGEKYDTTKAFADKVTSENTEVLTISHRGQEFRMKV